MELLLQPETLETLDEQQAVFWKSPAAWLRHKELSRDFWIFFTAALFFDFGFSIYYFLFNLYLLDLHFNERTMGLVGGALTLGSVAATLPAGIIARRAGLRPVLIVCMLAAPAVQACRVVWTWVPAQLALSFLGGMAMCLWGVCFLPAVARLTTEKSRASAFTLIFSMNIVGSALGGVVCGYLQQWLAHAGIVMQPVEVKRLILIASCGIAMLGLIPVLRLRLPSPSPEVKPASSPSTRWFSRWKPHPFLLRFLPIMTLWSAVLTAFNPFANVYLSHNLHVPMAHIGLIFSLAYILQFCLALMVPLLFRALGLVNGIVATQITTAVALFALAGATDARWAIAFYLCFSVSQWMSSPGIYSLLMTEMPDNERSTASSMTMFCNALIASVATATAGIFFTRFGYERVLIAIGVLALTVAALFRTFLTPQKPPRLLQP